MTNRQVATVTKGEEGRERKVHSNHLAATKHIKNLRGTRVGSARVKDKGGRVDVDRALKTVSGQSDSGDPKIGFERQTLKYTVITVARKPMVVVRSQD